MNHLGKKDNKKIYEPANTFLADIFSASPVIRKHNNLFLQANFRRCTEAIIAVNSTRRIQIPKSRLPDGFRNRAIKDS